MSRTSGFTLIEMLVALAVTSILLVTGSTLLIQTLRSGNMVETRTERVRALDAAHSLMRDDFANAVLRPTRGPDGLDAPEIFTGSEPRRYGPILTFTRAGWVNPADTAPRGDLQRVSYFLKDRQLVRRAWLRPDPVRETPFADRIMAENIDDIGLRFFAGGSWQLDWPGTSESLPELVELTFVFSEQDELRQLFLVGGSG